LLGKGSHFFDVCKFIVEQIFRIADFIRQGSVIGKILFILAVRKS